MEPLKRPPAGQPQAASPAGGVAGCPAVRTDAGATPLPLSPFEAAAAAAAAPAAAPALAWSAWGAAGAAAGSQGGSGRSEGHDYLADALDLLCSPAEPDPPPMRPMLSASASSPFLPQLDPAQGRRLAAADPAAAAGAGACCPWDPAPQLQDPLGLPGLDLSGLQLGSPGLGGLATPSLASGAGQGQGGWGGPLPAFAASGADPLLCLDLSTGLTPRGSAHLVSWAGLSCSSFAVQGTCLPASCHHAAARWAPVAACSSRIAAAQQGRRT